MQSAAPEPTHFCWLDNHRAEFLTLEAAQSWQREHGGTLAWLCDDCCGEHIGQKACCRCHGSLILEDDEGGAWNCSCPIAQQAIDEMAAYMEHELRGVPAREVFSERYLAESGIDPDAVAVPR